MESAGLEYRVRNHVSPHRYMRGKECAGQKTRLGAIRGELMRKLCQGTRITVKPLYTYMILGLPPAAAQVVGPNFAPFFRKTETASA